MVDFIVIYWLRCLYLHGVIWRRVVDFSLLRWILIFLYFQAQAHTLIMIVVRLSFWSLATRVAMFGHTSPLEIQPQLLHRHAQSLRSWCLLCPYIPRWRQRTPGLLELRLLCDFLQSGLCIDVTIVLVGRGWYDNLFHFYL